MRRYVNIQLWIVAAAVMALVVTACANIGSPEGGPRDYSPPVMVRCNPSPGTLNFHGNKVEIIFDENVNVKDQLKKVIVSPAPKDQPSIKVLGKKISVEFRDDLLPNTTYIIDFSDAIEDNNEGNVLDGFAVAFSTGSDLDTLRTSGMVLRANDLEPMQHVLVGIHSNLDDTAFTRLPFDRIARTNDRGEFTFLGLKPGNYRVYALNDLDGNYMMSRTEDYAWLDDVVVPTTGSYESMDTVFTFDHRVDTVKAATHVEYLPNNLFLAMFNERYTPLYLRKSERTGDNRFQVLFSRQSPSLPRVRLLSPSAQRDDWYSLEHRAGNDSVVYWLTDSTLIRSDSVVVAMDYLITDSLDHYQWQTDTLKMLYRKPASVKKAEEKAQKEHEKRAQELQKLRERRERLLSEGKDTEDVDEQIISLVKADSVPRAPLQIETVKTKLGIDDSLFVASSVPIASISPQGVHLQHFVVSDSTWQPMTIPAMCPADSCSLMRWVLPMTLEGGERYRFVIDRDAISSIYGVGNDSIAVELQVRSEDDYSNLYLNVNGLGGRRAFVELLSDSDKPLRQVTVDADGRVSIPHVDAGVYYARLVIDENGNNRWDAGCYGDKRQPEEVFYYPGKLKLRKNWDVEQPWDLYNTPVNQQKPDDIKRNKPVERNNGLDSKAKKKNSADDDDDDDEFSTGFGGRRAGTYSGDKYRDSRRN